MVCLAPLAAHAQPAAPTGLAVAPGDAQAVLTWNDPSDAAITGYQVRRGAGSPPAFNAWAGVPGSGASTMTATVAGLTNGVRYAFEVRAVSGSGNGAAARVSAALAASPSAAVTISDANLRVAVESRLGKSPGAAITQGEMAMVISLARGSATSPTNVASLSGLEHAVNLRRLRVIGGTVSDLSLLSGLTSLTALTLSRQSIADLSPLSGLTSLTTLTLDRNAITDVSPLSGLTSLTELLLNHNSIADVSPLRRLTSLTVLDMSANAIADVSPLRQLTSLTELYIEGNLIADVSSLRELTALIELWLADNWIADISQLSGLTSLIFLELGCNLVMDVSSLLANSGFASGDEVSLFSNPLDAASRNAHIPALEARGVTVSLTPLRDCRPPPPQASLAQSLPSPIFAPEATQEIEPAALQLGERLRLNGADYFADRDFDGLTFFASSSNPAIATTSVESGDIVVAGVAEGLAEITLTAVDASGFSASLSFMITLGNPASFGGSGGSDADDGVAAFTSAPEGGVAELAVSLAAPRDEDASFSWTLGADGDPNTADADAADHGGISGTATIAAGETSATIRIPIADDADIEPATEAFAVNLTPLGDAVAGVSRAIIHIREGVCDRTPQVADELRGARDCAAVSASELALRLRVDLADAGLAELRPRDFMGLSGMTALLLDGNGLSSLPAELFSAAPSLRALRLRGNRFAAFPAAALARMPALIDLDLGENLLTELPANAFAGTRALRQLRLDGNRIEALPAGLLAGLRSLSVLALHDNAVAGPLPEGFFAGVSELRALRLQGNPGAPFALDLALARARSDEEGLSEDEAALRLSLAQGAPFALSVRLSAAGAALSAPTADIGAGRTAGAPVTATRDEGSGAATAAIAAPPSLPTAVCGDYLDEWPCFEGFEVRVGAPLTLFGASPAAVRVLTLER